MTELTKSTDPIGGELRQLRDRHGYSLGDVERLSAGTFKAAVIASWERGDRRPTVEACRTYLAWYGRGYTLALAHCGTPPVLLGGGFVLTVTASGATQIECGACGNGAVDS